MPAERDREAYQEGYERAEQDYLVGRAFRNPFEEGTDASAGYQEAVYDYEQT